MDYEKHLLKKAEAFNDMERVIQKVPIKRINLIYEVCKVYPVSELAIRKRIDVLIWLGKVSEDQAGFLTWINKNKQ